MANRVYHWKHGWIPLDHAAAKKKYGSDAAAKQHGFGGEGAPEHHPVSHADLPRAGHVTATHSAKHGTFDVQDKQTGSRLSISSAKADEMQASGRMIEGLDRNGQLRTGPADGGTLPAPPKGLSKFDQAQYDREVQLARTWSDNELDSAIRGAETNLQASNAGLDQFGSAYALKPSTSRAILKAYLAEKKRRNSSSSKKSAGDLKIGDSINFGGEKVKITALAPDRQVKGGMNATVVTKTGRVRVFLRPGSRY